MSKDFWNNLSKRNKTTGYSDFAIGCFDQEMRLECIKLLLRKYDGFSVDKVSVLDFGCGNGDFVLRFADNVYRLTGYDISDEIISIARERSIQIPNVVFTSNLDELSSTFDIVFSITVLQHIVDDDELLGTLKKISALCNKGALFIALESIEESKYQVSQPAYVRPRLIDRWIQLFEEAGFDLVSSNSFYNPYLIKTPSFKLYEQRSRLIRKIYQTLRKFHWNTSIFNWYFRYETHRILQHEVNIDGIINEHSFSKIFVLRKN